MLGAIKVGICVLLAAGLVCGCGSNGTSAPGTPTSSVATPAQVGVLWKTAAAQLYPGGGKVQTGDSRGCHKHSGYTYSCVGYVRNATGSLSTGIDVAGTVNAKTKHATAHRGTTAEIQHWMSAYPNCNPCD
jgi:hypothetical protein